MGSKTVVITVASLVDGVDVSSEAASLVVDEGVEVNEGKVDGVGSLSAHNG